ncbi:DUF2938 family protein [Chitinolyticbacter albus]|uniref:DUF2938 family protein n=1 Tax=Chitinolyticbacter albus TaxID=2961951 RepID=UPI00210CA45A|nr:DUF2938 family protein [Chitinolyticbacter albus]
MPIEAIPALLHGLLLGVVATLATDVWTLSLRLLGIPVLDWAMVGRWIGHCMRGQFRHDSIAQAAAVRHERVLGWSTHYVTGLVFAAVFLSLVGPAWITRPTLAPPLVFGIATVLFPFLLLQPGLGLGVAAARTPRPWLARSRSIATHAVFGLGLYAGGVARLALS